MLRPVGAISASCLHSSYFPLSDIGSLGQYLSTNIPYSPWIQSSLYSPLSLPLSPFFFMKTKAHIYVDIPGLRWSYYRFPSCCLLLPPAVNPSCTLAPNEPPQCIDRSRLPKMTDVSEVHVWGYSIRMVKRFWYYGWSHGRSLLFSHVSQDLRRNDFKIRENEYWKSLLTSKL